MEFGELLHDVRVDVDALSDMAVVIRTSEGFQRTLAVMLAAGNFINGGTKKGGKHGFELETLSKIGGYKTTDNSMSILGFIFKFLNLHYPDALSWIDEMA